MEILLGTHNPSKKEYFARQLAEFDVSLVTLADLGIEKLPDEDGKTVLENAQIKAAYYGQFHDYVISADSALYIRELPLTDPRQPGLTIRRTADGHEMSEDEMLTYYASLAHSLGGRITCWYQDAGVKDKFREEEHDGKIYNYSGKIAFHATFNWLWEKAYIPITTAELAGMKPYEKAWVNFAGAGMTPDQLSTGVFQSNYPMCLLKVNATDEKGNVTRLHTVYFSRKDVGTAKARSYRICDYDIDGFRAELEKLPTGKYTIAAEVTASTGEIFTPVSLSWEK